MTARCGICGKWVSENASGALRAHWKYGTIGTRCPGGNIPGASYPLSERKPPKDVISVAIQFSPSQVFRCEVPMGLSANQQAEVVTAISVVLGSLQATWGGGK
jgi:hypothetical protein